MSDPVLRKRLTLAPKPAKPRVTFSRLRQAARQFKGSYGSKEQRRRNIREWLRAVEVVGPKWVYFKTVKLSKKGA